MTITETPTAELNDPLDLLHDDVLGVLHARYDTVVALQATPHDASAGGLHIPETAREKRTIGHVLAVGPEVDGLEPGDTICWPSYSGVPIPVDVGGKRVTLFAFKSRDILTIYKAE